MNREELPFGVVHRITQGDVIVDVRGYPPTAEEPSSYGVRFYRVLDDGEGHLLNSDYHNPGSLNDVAIASGLATAWLREQRVETG